MRTRHRRHTDLALKSSIFDDFRVSAAVHCLFSKSYTKTIAKHTSKEPPGHHHHRQSQTHTDLMLHDITIIDKEQIKTKSLQDITIIDRAKHTQT